MPTPSYETHNAPYDPNSDTYRANDGSYSTSGRPYDPLAYYVRRYLTRALVFGAVFAAAFYFATRWSHGAPMESRAVGEGHRAVGQPRAADRSPRAADPGSRAVDRCSRAADRSRRAADREPRAADRGSRVDYREPRTADIEAPALPTEAPEQPTQSPAPPTIEVRALPVRPEHWESPAPARRLDDVHHLADTMAATELPASPLSGLPDRFESNLVHGDVPKVRVPLRRSMCDNPDGQPPQAAGSNEGPDPSRGTCLRTAGPKLTEVALSVLSLSCRPILSPDPRDCPQPLRCCPSEQPTELLVSARRAAGCPASQPPSRRRDMSTDGGPRPGGAHRCLACSARPRVVFEGPSGRRQGW